MTLNPIRTLLFVAVVAGATGAKLQASSHMDAPLITLDDAANTTDVYAFLSVDDGVKYLTTALAVYPFEEPGIGPNEYRFDDDVRYELHVALGGDVGSGNPTLTYRFEFQTAFQNPNTILQAFTGVVADVGGLEQNLLQTYSVTRIDVGTGQETVLGTGVVPPNNQGIVTPFYNRKNDGTRKARGGVDDAQALDRYTAQSISSLALGHRVFAGQRDDGFYADIQAIFDLLSFKKKGSDSQGGFNVHTMVLDIPLSELGGDQQVVGVYATTSRARMTVLSPDGNDVKSSDFVQIGRQGNPLFCEALVALSDKDLYNRSSPSVDATLFGKYAFEPELAKLINLVIGQGKTLAIETNRTDIAGIFIPDLIKIDLSTDAPPLAGTGKKKGKNSDDKGFSRLSIFGGDVLISQIQEGLGGGVVPAGFPNGRRFGDDVVDIAVSALLSDLRDPNALVINSADGIDGVNKNDISYNKVFPYAATPLNGRKHSHH